MLVNCLLINEYETHTLWSLIIYTENELRLNKLRVIKSCNKLTIRIAYFNYEELVEIEIFLALSYLICRKL